MQNWHSLEQKLWRAAKRSAPDGHVPYRFEKRVMAALAGSPPADPLAGLARALWRAALSSVGVMLLMVALSWHLERANSIAEFAGDDLETALLQTLDSEENPW